MRGALWLIAGTALSAMEGGSCSVSAIVSNVDLVRTADSVIRARAVDYAKAPRGPGISTTGLPDSEIRFKVMETVRGQQVNNLLLHGYLVSSDDFNDKPSPYSFVRPGGRSGSCFANSYRRDGEYLLFLKKTGQDGFTVNWAALAPVNEQLRSADDPWLIWVRQEAKKVAESGR